MFIESGTGGLIKYQVTKAQHKASQGRDAATYVGMEGGEGGLLSLPFAISAAGRSRGRVKLRHDSTITKRSAHIGHQAFMLNIIPGLEAESYRVDDLPPLVE